MYHYASMNSYKLVLLLRSDLKKDVKDKLLEEIKKQLSDMRSEKVESMGEKKLAYPVKRERSGEFAVMSFESDKVTPEFNNRLQLRDEILRHLLIRN